MGQTQGKAPEGFDEARETRALKRLKVDDLRRELESRGKDASGTADRLRTRLLDALREDAMDVDVGDELSPLSDDELLVLVRKQRNPNMSRTGSRPDWITGLKARNVLDAHGHFDPRLNKPGTIIFERDITEHPEDEWWVTAKGPKRVNGKKIMVASSRGKPAPGGGTKHNVPVELAAHATKVLELADVQRSRTDVWESAAAAPYKSEALWLLSKPAERVDHGCWANDAKNTRLDRLRNGTVVARTIESVDGCRVVHTTVVDTTRVASLRLDECVGRTPAGLADFSAFFASVAIEDPATARAKMLELCEVAEDAELEEVEALSAAHFVELAALLDEKDVDLAQKSGYARLMRRKKLVVEHRRRLHLIDKDCPGRAAAIQAWRESQSLHGRGKDAQKDYIRDKLRPPGWQKRNETTIMHDIIKAAMPELARPRLRCVLDYLVSKAQLDHIFSGVVDHPTNLIVEFAGPNGHFSDFRNGPGKRARYGADVMRVAADWIRLAISSALGVVSCTTESA